MPDRTSSIIHEWLRSFFSHADCWYSNDDSWKHNIPNGGHFCCGQWTWKKQTKEVNYNSVYNTNFECNITLTMSSLGYFNHIVFALPEVVFMSLTMLFYIHLLNRVFLEARHLKQTQVELLNQNPLKGRQLHSLPLTTQHNSPSILSRILIM